MTQKDTVYNFLRDLEENTDNPTAWKMFTEVHPDITKSNFDYYRNQAAKENVYIPGVKKIVTPIDVSTKILNERELVVETIDLNNIDMKRFKAIPTGTAFDKIASKRNGFMPGTTYIITGESGAGKTTVATNLADYLKENNENYTAGFISGEMDKDDWTEECIDNPRLATLETVFMLNYLDASNYVEILTSSLIMWNFVILDSFEVVIDQLRELKGWTAKKAESTLINIMRTAAAESGCTIFAIQQYTKGGTFVGSNKIKHMLTGMIFVKFDKHGDRYVIFTKNRRGGHMVGKPMYFTKNKQTGRIEFDNKRFENDQAITEFKSEEAEQIQEEAGIFDTLILEKAEEAQKRRENIMNINNTENN